MLTPTQLIQLKAELLADPKHLGYAQHITAGDPTLVAGVLNSTYPGVAQVWRNDLMPFEVLASLVEAEVHNMDAVKWQRISTLLIPRMVDVSQPRIRDQFVGIFSDAQGSTTPFTATIGNLIAAGTKASPSRAEELWGYNTVIAWEDVQAALALPG